jgi:nucleoid DNA-binding protein
MKKHKPATKSAMLQALSSRTELTRKQIATLVDELANYIKQEIGITGAGVIALLGLLKIKRVEKPATEARQGRNPQTGEIITIPAKPKRTVVKVLPLKALKEVVK